jgi:hypothetical protein
MFGASRSDARWYSRAVREGAAVPVDLRQSAHAKSVVRVELERPPHGTLRLFQSPLKPVHDPQSDVGISVVRIEVQCAVGEHQRRIPD